MAFLEFHRAPATLSADSVERAAFSAVERTVLMLARRDPRSSLRAPGLWADIVTAVFGMTRHTALADPKLEALRRMAVTARRCGARAVARETARFIASGYTALQAATAIRSARIA